jgi:hypothetical protein
MPFPLSKQPKAPFVPPEHGLGRYAWLVEIGGALLVVAILCITDNGSLFRDSCCLWHPVVGELIQANGLIREDPFSHTFAGELWIPFQWLAEVGMARLYAWAEYDGIFWATVALFSSIFGWLAGRAVRAGCHPILALLIIALTFFECCHHFHARPHLFTMGGMCFLLALLSDVEAGRTRKAQLLWLVPVFIVWANLHGGVLGGWGTLGIVMSGWGLWWLLGWPAPIQSWRTALLLVLLCLIVTASFLINPYGWDFILMWKRVMAADLPKIINEHKPLDPLSPIGLVILGEALLYFLVLAGIILPKVFRSVDPTGGTNQAAQGIPLRVTWLIPLIWLYLGASRIRHAPLFSLVAMIAIIDMLPHTLWMRWLARRSDLYVAPRPDDPLEPRAGIVLARLFPMVIFLVPLLAGLRFVKLDEERWPQDLIPELRRLAKDPDLKLFNEDHLAGMVIRYVPGMKVFIDDRCELYPEWFLMDYVDALRERPGYWIAYWEEKYGINAALTAPKSKFTAYFREAPNWRLVRETEAGCLFIRQKAGSASAGVIEKRF